jgi:hypothetical protein
MQDKIVVVYTFKRNKLTIRQLNIEEGADSAQFEVEKIPVTLAFTPATDPETGVETCFPTCNGKPVFTNMPIMLEGEEILPEDSHAEKKRKMTEGLSVQVNLIFPELEVRPAREDGKKCRDCGLWNKEVGVEELEKVTHVYQNGDGKMLREICEAMSVMHGKPLLTKNNVGYCPKNQELVAETAPGCDNLVEKSK